MTQENPLSELQQPQVTNLSQVKVETVKADMVRMNQSAAQVIEAEDVELHNSAAADVTADRLHASGSALALVQSGETIMQDVIVGAVRAETMSMKGNAGAVIAGSAHFDNSYAGIVAAREVKGEKIETMILLSSRVEGNVTTIMDTRGALVVGLVGGLFAGIMLLLTRMLFRQK